MAVAYLLFLLFFARTCMDLAALVRERAATLPPVVSGVRSPCAARTVSAPLRSDQPVSPPAAAFYHGAGMESAPDLPGSYHGGPPVSQYADADDATCLTSASFTPSSLLEGGPQQRGVPTWKGDSFAPSHV